MADGMAKKSDWYVIQVRTGSERRMCDLIAKTVEVHNAATAFEDMIRLEECFSASFMTQKKIHGKYVEVERLLMPGYVVAVTSTPTQLAEVLRGIRAFCRILAVGDRYIPLAGPERAWLEETTKVNARLLPMSFGFKVGDTLTVTKGPLQGYEAIISRADRENSLAHVEVHVGPMTVKATVGLGILPEQRLINARNQGEDPFPEPSDHDSHPS